MKLFKIKGSIDGVVFFCSSRKNINAAELRGIHIPLRIKQRIFVMGVLLLAFSLIADDTPSASRDLFYFNECAKNLKKIVSVDAEISQYITENGGNQETFQGRFRALATGAYRIDYTVPEKQQVFYNGRTLSWYFPEQKILYRSSAFHDAPVAAGVMRQITERDMKSSDPVCTGPRRAGFFTTVTEYTFFNSEYGLKTSIWIDPEKKVLLRKTITSGDDYEISREVYSDYRGINGIFFPGKVEVLARAGTGVTESVTEYSAVILNGAIPETIFNPEIPGDVIIRNFHEKH